MSHVCVVLSCFPVISMQIILFSPYSSEILRARGVIFIPQMKLRIFLQHSEFRNLISTVLLGYHISLILKISEVMDKQAAWASPH